MMCLALNNMDFKKVSPQLTLNAFDAKGLAIWLLFTICQV